MLTPLSARRRRLEVLLPFLPAVGIISIIVAIVTIAGLMFFMRGKVIMEEQLKDKLRSTAASAAMQFDADALRSIGQGDTITSSPALRTAVEKLNRIRETITNVRFAYIMRKTEDPTILEFVADGDLALTPAELDVNHNGRVDEDEAASDPGELYDATLFPALVKDAFLHPTVDEEIGDDQWGRHISGYAPIRDEVGHTVGVIGIDMDATDYTSLATSIFSPIALLLFILASLAIATAVTLILWHRRLDELQRLEIERSGLLRLAFHQLGGPLTIINWSLEELEEEGPACIQRTIVNIQEGVKRLSAILQTLKSADLVHAGKIEYKPEFASLSSILEQVVRESGSKVGIRKQRIALELEENITMKLDPNLIMGVARELLTNAIDFSKDGSTITVRSTKHGSHAEFSVIDHGCGIPKKDMKRVFDEFSRGSNATKYKADGNGLGLYIVRGIVEEAGGTINVQSEEGKGTTVTVKLPIV